MKNQFLRKSPASLTLIVILVSAVALAATPGPESAAGDRYASTNELPPNKKGAWTPAGWAQPELDHGGGSVHRPKSDTEIELIDEDGGLALPSGRRYVWRGPQASEPGTIRRIRVSGAITGHPDESVSVQMGDLQVSAWEESAGEGRMRLARVVTRAGDGDWQPTNVVILGAGNREGGSVLPELSMEYDETREEWAVSLGRTRLPGHAGRERTLPRIAVDPGMTGTPATMRTSKSRTDLGGQEVGPGVVVRGGSSDDEARSNGRGGSARDRGEGGAQ